MKAYVMSIFQQQLQTLVAIGFGLTVLLMGFVAPGHATCPPPVTSEPSVGLRYYQDVAINETCDLLLNIVAPSPQTPPFTPWPALAYIHGGGWSKDDNNYMNTILNYARKHEYVGVAIRYRLTPSYRFPTQLDDVKLAIAYLRAHAAQYFLDPHNIGVWGTSAGGHLAALLGTAAAQDPASQVQAVVDFYGPADFTTESADEWASLTALLGHRACADLPHARTAMPTTYIAPSTSYPPFLILHGDVDRTVPCTDSTHLTKRLRQAGVEVTFGLVNGAGHALKTFPWTTDLAWQFLDAHLKGIGTPPPATPLQALNPVAWWKFEEVTVATPVEDVSSALPYTPMGVVLKRNNRGQQVPEELGRAGRALRFLDGCSYLSNADRNDTAQVQALNFIEEMSVETWVKFDQLPGTTIPLRDVKLVYRVNSDPNAKGGYELFVSARDNKPRFRIWLNSITKAEVRAAESLTTGQWYHLVGTYDGTHLHLYVNGVLEKTTPWSGGIGSGGNTYIKLGGTSSQSCNGIKGSLDEVRLYNQALTLNEVQTRYLSLAPPDVFRTDQVGACSP